MRNAFKYLTVEPSFFIYIFLYDWMHAFDTNLYLQKSCRFNHTTEPDLNTPCDDEKRGILYVSEVNSKYHFLVIFLSTLLTIFATSWSDKAGRRRRPLIYMPIVGHIFRSLSGILHSYFWQWTPMAAVLSWVVFESISGGICLFIAACQIYVCDEGDIESRTMRLGFLGATKLICFILGQGASGLVLRSFGFFYSYLLSFTLSVICLLLGLIFIKDTSVSVEKKLPFYRLLNLKDVLVDSFKVIFKRKLGRKRVIISLLIFAHIAINFTLFGELSVLYPYLRYRFGWDERKYSDYLFYRFSVGTLGVLFCSVILSKCLKIHDGLIGILAASFDTFAIVGLLLASQIWQIYLVPLMDVFHGTALLISLSFISKYYDASEIGRLNAVIGVFSLVAVPLCFPTYNTIFQKTLETFPSAFCLPSMVLDVCISLCFCGSYFLSRKFDVVKPPCIQEETHTMIVPT